MASLKSPQLSDPMLGLYFQEIGNVKLLTAEEEKDLARQVAKGSGEAFETLVLANLRFVIFVAKRYRRCNMPMMDLVAEGNVGLLEAVVRFDPDVGCRFTTYAYWRIRKSISDALRGRTRMVHVPALMVDRMKEWAQAADAIRQGDAREPTTDEMGAALKLSRKASRLVQRTIETAIGSVRTGARDETWNKLAETVPDASARCPAEEAQHREELSVLRTLFERLDPQDRRVLELRFGMRDHEPKTLRAVGEELQVTHETVRHIERRALARLCDAMRTLHRIGSNGAPIPSLL